MWVKSLVVEGREGSRILLRSLRSMEMVSQSEGRWFDDLWPCLNESWMGMVERVMMFRWLDNLSLPSSSFHTTSKVASTAASRVTRSDGNSRCWNL